jgi:hypothetical protein
MNPSGPLLVGKLANAVRILTRVMPILFEDEDEESFSADSGTENRRGFVHRVFWQSQIPPSNPESEEWETLEDFDAAFPPGRMLVHSIMACLFLPGYTISAEQFNVFLVKLNECNATREKREAKRMARSSRAIAAAAGNAVETEQAIAEEEELVALQEADEGPVPDEANALWPMLLWVEGIGPSRINLPETGLAAFERRADLLRLLLAVCSQPLYSTGQQSTTNVRSLFLDEATLDTCPFAPTLFFSLMNTIMSFDTIGMGIPYSNAFVGNKDESTANMASRALAILLDYSPFDLDADASEEQKDADGGKLLQFNVYRSLLLNLKDEDDHAFLFENICRLLQTKNAAESALLPGSYQGIDCHMEIILLLWRLLDMNESFRSFVLNHADVTLCTAPLLHLMWMSRQSLSQVGLEHLCTFLLLLLSGHRAFGVKLAEPVKHKLPSDFPLFEGSHIDELIIVLHKLVVDGVSKLSSLYSCILTIIANVSPYAKNIGLVAAMKLVNLFELFSSPAFLFAKPNNFLFIHQLIETFNNILQYQYDSNGVFTYALLRKRDLFENLITQTVSGYRAEVVSRSSKRLSLKAKATTANSTRPIPTSSSPKSPKSPTTPATSAAAPGGSAASPVAPSPPSSSSSNESTSLGEAVNSSSLSGESSLPPPPPLSSWIATDSWRLDMLAKLPLLTTQKLLGYLGPMLEDHIKRCDNIVDDEDVIKFIRSTSVVGVLPVPHPILSRKYIPNEHTGLWFTTLAWSTVFISICNEVPVWDAEMIKLFSITTTPS